MSEGEPLAPGERADGQQGRPADDAPVAAADTDDDTDVAAAA